MRAAESLTCRGGQMNANDALTRSSMLSNSPIEASIETLQIILNAVPTPLFIKDRKHRLVLVNDAMCELAGCSRGEMLNRAPDWLPDEQTAVFCKVDDEVFATGRPKENEEVSTDGTGSLRVQLTRKRLIHLPTDDGEQPFILATISDITHIREAERRARYLAEHDALTGLANRAQLDDRLKEATAAASKNRREVALLLLDLDQFKDINDTHGHPVGDEVLRVTAKRLAGLVRTTDTVARFGGDEFCIVQTGAQQPDSAMRLAERILSSLSQPITVSSLSLSVSASIGIALFPDHGATSELLLQHADKALYTIKHNGRRDFAFYHQTQSKSRRRQWDIATDLRAALAADQLSLEFQPLMHASDGKVRGFEALARWQHPTRGPIPPEVFIPAAEDAGVIMELGAWVLEKACTTAVSWPPPLQASVNVSPLQLEGNHLPAMVENVLASSGLPAARLELEITESALLGGTEDVLSIFQQLKALGVSLALDDFGAGWSSLSALQRFPFDRLKIDRSFIASLGADARSVAIVRAVLSLAQSLNLPVTAEGVEQQAQLVALRQMGCAELQGFLIGRPSPVAILPGPSSEHCKVQSSR